MRTARTAPGRAPRSGSPRSLATTTRPVGAETTPPVAPRSGSPIRSPRARYRRPASTAPASRRSRPVLAEEDCQALRAVARRWRRGRVAVALAGMEGQQTGDHVLGDRGPGAL